VEYPPRNPTCRIRGGYSGGGGIPFPISVCVFRVGIQGGYSGWVYMGEKVPFCGPTSSGLVRGYLNTTTLCWYGAPRSQSSKQNENSIQPQSSLITMHFAGCLPLWYIFVTSGIQLIPTEALGGDRGLKLGHDMPRLKTGAVSLG
jgi:hypothetical protein